VIAIASRGMITAILCKRIPRNIPPKLIKLIEFSGADYATSFVTRL
jgi:hypothetical protein